MLLPVKLVKIDNSNDELKEFYIEIEISTAYLEILATFIKI